MVRFGMIMMVAACSPSVPTPDPAASSTPTADTTRVLALEHNSGWTEAGVTIAADQAAWDAGWSRTYANTSGAPPQPAVDLARQVVAFVAAGQRGSGGFTLLLERSGNAAGRAVVDVVVQTPGPECGTTAALTEPVLVLAIPRGTAPPEVRVTERAGPRC